MNRIALFAGRTPLLAVLAALLTSCAATQEGDLRTGDPCTQGFVDELALARTLAAAKSCCGSFASMSFSSRWMNTIVAIDKSAPVFEFPSGKSRFVALSLADIDERSLVLTPASSTALTAPPDFTCGRDQSVVRSRALKPVVQWLRPDKSAFGPPERGTSVVTRGAAGWRFVRPQGAAFLVIYTLPGEYGQSLELDAPPGLIFTTSTVGLAAAMAPQRTLGPAKFTVSGTGFFEVSSER